MRRLVGFALVWVVFGILETALARRPEQARLRRGFGTDVAWFFLGRPLGDLATVLVLAPLAVVLWLLVPRGLEAGVASLPGWVQVAAALVVSDLAGYAYHRAAHRVPWLWRIHSVHHSSQELDWLASVRVHPLDTALGLAARVVPLFALGFPLGILGGVAGLLRLEGLLFHANTRIEYGPFKFLVASPEFHQWHHAREIDANYAGQFPVWDWLFGTLHLPEGERAEVFGTRQPLPEGFLAQLAHPLRG